MKILQKHLRKPSKLSLPRADKYDLYALLHILVILGLSKAIKIKDRLLGILDDTKGEKIEY